MVLYLGEERVRELLHWDRLIPAMEQALAAFSLGRVVQPVRNMLTIEEGKRYFGVMPAVAEDAMGAKLVSFFPGNAGSIPGGARAGDPHANPSNVLYSGLPP